jgi:hypothetical protein
MLNNQRVYTFYIVLHPVFRGFIPGIVLDEPLVRKSWLNLATWEDRPPMTTLWLFNIAIENGDL